MGSFFFFPKNQDTCPINPRNQTGPFEQAHFSKMKPLYHLQIDFNPFRDQVNLAYRAVLLSGPQWDVERKPTRLPIEANLVISNP